ncbi:thioredoxin family protein [Psychromarinibacter sp. C21-152]|uniref:Thioredoxin family protein n=1 Tax=Psychromarinibacter sediminicola TaxID=3033385 RepID=A0AAE3NQ80_9RHOB|nr:thioredoxin family protein [Psychromarinibacter sediminicola]MDF0600016.1 thioredoxin family protein [Psychromarinibacter sediminicola]
MTRILTMAAAVLFMAGAAWGEELGVGDDGLHKSSWMRDTFKDLQDDLAEANAEGKRLMLIIEQRGCIYCRKMHEEVFVRDDIATMLEEDFFVIQINMFGDVEVTDFDGEAMREKEAVRRWRQQFTPTIMLFPEEVPEDQTAEDAALVVMPGAFSANTTKNLLTWVRDKIYLEQPSFQKYHADMINAQKG